MSDCDDLHVLFPYQREGAAFLAARRYALLADEMGLGKSAQAIVAAELIDARNVLVLCPAVARVNWAREWEKFAIDPPPIRILFSGRDRPAEEGVTIGSYDLLAQRALRERLEAQRYDVLIADEAHYLKSRRTKRTRAVLGEHCDARTHLAACSERLWALTGTPAPNHPGELWPLLRAFGVARAGYWDFVRAYCAGFDNGFGFKITGGRNLPRLRAQLAPILLRRKKVDVMSQLPPISWREVLVGPSEVDVEVNFPHYLGYKPGQFERDLETQYAMVETVIRTARDGSWVDALAKLNNSISTLRQYTGLAKMPAVAEIVANDLEAGLDKVVIFAEHRNVIEGLRHALRRFGAVNLYGGTDPSQRQKRVDRFQNDPKCRVFIGNIRAAGTAITLTAASEVVFAEASWVPADNAQAAMRVHRIGQTRPVRIRWMTLDNSIDIQVQRALRRKTKTITALFD